MCAAARTSKGRPPRRRRDVADAWLGRHRRETAGTPPHRRRAAAPPPRRRRATAADRSERRSWSSGSTGTPSSPPTALATSAAGRCCSTLSGVQEAYRRRRGHDLDLVRGRSLRRRGRDADHRPRQARQAAGTRACPQSTSRRWRTTSATRPTRLSTARATRRTFAARKTGRGGAVTATWTFQGHVARPRYGVANATATIVDAILFDRKAVLPVSVKDPQRDCYLSRFRRGRRRRPGSPRPRTRIGLRRDRRPDHG